MRSFANSSITSYATGDEELLSMADDDFSFLEASYADESSYAEDMASIATDPNVIAIGIPAGPTPQEQERQNQILISEVVANDIAAKEHNLKMRGTERAIIERRLSSPCIKACSLAEAKRHAMFSSFTARTEPGRSFLQSMDAPSSFSHSSVLREPDQLVVDDFPPTSSRSMGSSGSDDILSQETPRFRGRKSAILANTSTGLNSLHRQQKIHYALRDSVTGGIVTRMDQPPKSNSNCSNSPPTIPVRKSSGSTIYSRDETNEEGWDAQTESAETANGASVATFSSGIDLDDKTRNNIISRSSSMHIARRRNSMQASAKENGEPPSSLKSLRAIERTASLPPSVSKGGKGQANTTVGKVSTRKSRPSDEKNSARNSRRSLSEASSSSRHKRSSDEKEKFHNDDGEAGPCAHAVSPASGDHEREEEDPGTGAASDHDGLPFGPVMASDILQEADDQESSRDLEAQAGVPVVLPGAFSVRPISSSADQMGQPSSGYDSGFEDDTVVSDDDNTHADVISSSQRDPPEERPAFRPVVTSAPVEAELYEVDYAQAQVVEPGDDEKAVRKRVRLFQAFLFFLCLAIGAGIAMGVVFSSDGGDQDCKDDCVPTIRGWDQLGDLLTGPTNSDSIQYGYSVAMSGDGYRVAIGLPGLDRRNDEGISSQVGGVFIMDFNGTGWATTFELHGHEVDGNAGTAVVISEDGKRVAFGAPGTADGGYVAMYQEESDGKWEMLGDILDGSALVGTSAFGTSLALSSNGEILAVGDQYASFGETSTDVGTVRMYHNVDGTWAQLGQELHGRGANELFGWSIALSRDGRRLAASAVGSDRLRGEVRVFDFENEDNWVQVGPSLFGEKVRETFGVSLALGNDGGIMAVGSNGYSEKGTSVGRVIAYNYDAVAKVWMPMGEPMNGDAQFDRFGSAVALSIAGDTLAIGSPENDTFGKNAGFVKIMRYDGSSWTQVGSKLGRLDSEGGLFGQSIALSSDGSHVVGGAPALTYDGKLSKVGRVWVYEQVDTDA